jgi:hypothetical protein
VFELCELVKQSHKFFAKVSQRALRFLPKTCLKLGGFLNKARKVASSVDAFPSMFSEICKTNVNKIQGSGTLNVRAGR